MVLSPKGQESPDLTVNANTEGVPISFSQGEKAGSRETSMSVNGIHPVCEAGPPGKAPSFDLVHPELDLDSSIGKTLGGNLVGIFGKLLHRQDVLQLRAHQGLPAGIEAAPTDQGLE